ncbi:MAG: hypothetical protein RIC04_15005 [Parvibaculum sp.]|uniref:hypothetical protein n=1 Tax=Parvibaculum sp. TaxID=2024848 RepID=UPI0032EF6BCC
MDSEDLKQYSTWYVALIAVGAVIASASAASGNAAALLVGLGFVLVGVGEFINHPFRSDIQFDDVGRPAYQISGRARAPKVVGLAVDAFGVVLLLLGLYRIVLS